MYTFLVTIIASNANRCNLTSYILGTRDRESLLMGRLVLW